MLQEKLNYFEKKKNAIYNIQKYANNKKTTFNGQKKKSKHENNVNMECVAITMTKQNQWQCLVLVL